MHQGSLSLSLSFCVNELVEHYVNKRLLAYPDIHISIASATTVCYVQLQLYHVQLTS